MMIGGLEVDLSADHLRTYQLIAEGDRYRDIAAKMCVSVPTVQRWVNEVCAALGAKGRIEALLMLIAEDLVR